MGNKLIDYLCENFEEVTVEEMMEELNNHTVDEFCEVANLIVTLNELPECVINEIFERATSMKKEDK